MTTLAKIADRALAILERITGLCIDFGSPPRITRHPRPIMAVKMEGDYWRMCHEKPAGVPADDQPAAQPSRN